MLTCCRTEVRVYTSNGLACKLTLFQPERALSTIPTNNECSPTVGSSTVPLLGLSVRGPVELDPAPLARAISMCANVHLAVNTQTYIVVCTAVYHLGWLRWLGLALSMRCPCGVLHALTFGILIAGSQSGAKDRGATCPGSRTNISLCPFFREIFDECAVSTISGSRQTENRNDRCATQCQVVSLPDAPTQRPNLD